MLSQSETDAQERMKTANRRYRATFDQVVKTLIDMQQLGRYCPHGTVGMTGRSRLYDCYVLCVKRKGAPIMSILFLADAGDIKLWCKDNNQVFAGDDDGLQQCQTAALALLKELVPPSFASQLAA